MKKACLTIFFLLFLLSFTFSFIMNSVPVKASLTKMFVSPSYSILTDSIYFTVEVRVENVWKMNSYQAYLWWDPELLNVTEVIQSPFLSNNSQYTTSFTSRINNTLGRLIVIEAQLVGNDWPETAVGGNATLFTVNFMAKSTGQCLLHLNKTDINYGTGDVSHDTEDGFFNNELYNVEAGGGNFPVKVESNSTVYNFDFNLSEMSVSFNVSGVSGSAGWVNVTIPKALLDAPDDQWTILLDTTPTTYTKTENATHTYLHINYTHTTHTITIKGTQVIPELTLLTLLILLTAVFATVILFVKKIQK